MKNKMTDEQVNQVLSDFRASVLRWSDEEWKTSAARVTSSPVRVRTSFGQAWQWGLATAALLTVAALPVLYHTTHSAPSVPVAETAPEKSAIRPATQSEMEDSKLLRDIDADVSQSAPDAMQPLADLMSTSSQDDATN